MNRIFLELLNSSIVASWLILAVLVLRFALKKGPKWINGVLWVIVAIRLVCPFSIESTLSLIPCAKPVPIQIELMESTIANTGMKPVDDAINPMIAEEFATDVTESMNPLLLAVDIASVVWITGVFLLLGYSFFSFRRLKRKVSASVRIEDKIFRCDDIDSPFILGVFKPCIYIPSGINPLAYEYILAHERAHLKRGDHFWKPLGFALLAVYWFHPLCWVAYMMLCKDIELACDEKATREMDKNSRANYCQALLACSVNRRMIAACPVAFGEVGVKDRVKAVLNYKKPTFWIISTAVAVCVIVSVCFLTNPREDEGESKGESIDEIVKTEIDQTETESLIEKNTVFIKKWADAFCSRNGQNIVNYSSKDVQDSLIERGLLTIADDYYSFGHSSPWPIWEEGISPYWIVNQNDENSSAEILYYAWTSDPHVSVWKEYISFEETNGEFVVTEEDLRCFENIASGMEYDEAYPVINGTLMDYSVNGMGDVLVTNSMLSSSYIFFDLQDPVKAAKSLLNLLDNENKVKVEMLQEDSKISNLKITFSEDGVERMISMVQLEGESGIWIPQDYGTDRKADISEVISRVLEEYDFQAVAWNNTLDWKKDADVLIKMATDATGRYEIYGIISREYGSYGMVINDTIDGTDINTNYIYVPWFYTGAASDEPQLLWVDNELLFTYPMESDNGERKQQLCYVECGYETAHAELFRFLEPDIENQIENLIKLEIENNEIKCISRKNEQVIAVWESVGKSGNTKAEIALSNIFYLLDAQKMIIGVQEIDTATNNSTIVGFLSFDFNTLYLENGEVGFELSNPGTYSAAEINDLAESE